jgi:hypothetical protein
MLTNVIFREIAEDLVLIWETTEVEKRRIVNNSLTDQQKAKAAIFN